MLHPHSLDAPQASSRIFIHAMNFWPELIGCGKYTSELAFSLAQKGHRVEALSAPPHYPGWSVRAPYSAWRYVRETVRGVVVWRCPIIAGGGGGLRRAIAPLTFALFAAPLVMARILVLRPDVVLCVEPTLLSAPAAMLAAKMVGARTVLHVQDLEVDAAFSVGHLKGKWLARLISAFERRILAQVDLAVTISNSMRRALLKKGVDPERTAIIRNWVDLDAAAPPSDKTNVFREELGLDAQTFVALYAGHIGAKQALHVLLDAARLCRNVQNLHFVVAGDGPEKARLQADYADLPNLTFLPLQPPDRFAALLALADVHMLTQMKQAADFALPSKLGAMLASGRPIVATADPGTELADLLCGAALLAPTEDPDALSKAILSAARTDPGALAERRAKLAKSLSDKVILPEFEAILLGPRRNLGATAVAETVGAARP